MAFLGEGGSGRVWRVEDPVRPGAGLALKVLRRPPPAAAGAGAGAFREVRASMRIRHPVLAEVVEAGFLDSGRSRAYLLSELVEGEHPLAPLGPEVVRSVAEDLLSGLEAVHAAGWIHGDIHPRNVVVSARGASRPSARLLDLGLARRLAAGPPPGAAGGVPRYLAPEVLRGEAADERADLYALGLVLLEALRGPLRAPVADHILATLDGSFHREVRAWAPPGALGRLLAASLRDDPERRLRSASDGLEILARDGARARRSAASCAPSFEAGETIAADDFLAAVDEALGRLYRADGRVSILCVEGETGLGKTRRIREAVLAGLERGVRCISWDQAVLEAGALRGPPEPEPGWMSLDPGDRPAALGVERAADAVLGVLGEAPTLLAVDDVDRLDPSAGELLRLTIEKAASPRRAGRNARRSPLAVVLAASPTGLRGPLAASWRRWAGLPWSSRHAIRPWSDRDARRFLDAVLLPRRDLGRDEERLLRDHGGRPGGLRVALRELALAGALRRDGWTWRLDRDALRRFAGIPGEGERLRRDWAGLSSGGRDVLACAALCLETRETVSAEELAAVLAVPIAEVRGALRSLGSTESFAAMDGLRSGAPAALALPRATRLRILRACGLRDRVRLRRAIARGAPSPAARVDQALRFGPVSARDLRAAVEEGGRAAERVLARHALSRRGAPAERLRSALRLGERLMARADHARARRLLAEAVDLAAVPRERGRALVLLAEADAGRGARDEARRSLEAARPLLPAGSEDLARCLFDRAVLALRDREPAADRLAAECAARYPHLPAFQNLLGTLRLEAGDVAGAEARFEAAVRLAARRRRPHERASAATNLARARLRLGRAAESAAILRDAARDFERSGLRAQQALALGNLGAALRRAGDFGGAEEALRAALDLWREMGDPGGIAVTRANLGILAREVGLPGSAWRHLRAAEEAAAEAGASSRRALEENDLLLESRALLALDLDDAAEARRLWRRIRAGPDRGMPPGPERLLLEVRLLAGDASPSRQGVDRALRGREPSAADAPWLLLVAEGGAALGDEAAEALRRVGRTSRVGRFHEMLLAAAGESTADRERARALRWLAREAPRLPLRDARRRALVEVVRRAAGGRERARAGHRLRLAIEEALLDLPTEIREDYMGRRDIQEASQAARRADSAGAPAPEPSRTVAALSRLTREILLERDSESLLRKLVDAAIELTGAERGILALRRRGRLDVAAARAGGEDLKEPDRHFSRTILERTLSDRAARIASDARHDVELRSIASVEELGLRSVLCVPLLGTGPEPRGALYLDNAMREGIFGADQLELAESFCAHAALAWEIAERRQEREALVGQLRAAKRRLEAELDVTRREAVERSADASGEFQGMVGRGPRMRELFRWIEAVAPTDLPVLITGESGAGKELVARAIHRSSRRSERPLVAENLGAVPGGLLESILFGHVKGAFTGADRRRAGLFELAHEGTLFLDEIGLLPLDLQSRLLRALQEGEVRPLGSDATVRVDVRVVAATNEDVRRAVGDGRFREDLYYRLQGAEVRVPPLRERTEDLPDLVARFLRKAAAAGAATSKVSREAMDRLAAYPWPGNVRELENEVRRAAALSAGRTIQVGDLSPQVRDCILLPSRGGDRPDRPVRTLAEAERDAILHAMSHFRGRRGKVAEALGVARSTLYLKLRELGYDR